MFTGIVEEIGEVVDVRRTEEVLVLTVRGPLVATAVPASMGAMAPAGVRGGTA